MTRSTTTRPPDVSSAAPLREPDPFEIFATLFTRSIGRIFNMTYQAGRIRQMVLAVMFVLTWTALAFLAHPIPEWQSLILATFNPALQPDVANPMAALLQRILGAYLGLDVIGHLIALILPLVLALQVAATFLDDVYELKSIEIARRFITQAAFVWPGFGILHIQNGDVPETEKKDPMFLIGGPGRVQVNLENVALFEKIDGTPEVIGPTVGQPAYTRTIDGFEKLRQVIDIRDQTVKLNLDARTKDGIHLKAESVRLLFSVQRTTSLSTLARPYPFASEGILSLVYDQGRGPWYAAMQGLVRGALIGFISDRTFGEIFAAAGEPEVRRQMERQSIIQRLIWQQRNRNRRYRSLNNLRANITASTAVPLRRPVVRKYPKEQHPAEMTTHKPRRYRSPFRASPVSSGSRASRLTSPGGLLMYTPRRPAGWTPWVAIPYPNGGIGGKKFRRIARYPRLFRPDLVIAAPPPPFMPRLQISQSFFQEFVRSFPERARQRGVRLEWIDVGTWHVPDTIIQSQHNEAWNLTMENILRSTPDVLSGLRMNGQTTEQIRLLRRTLYRFVELNQQGLDRDAIIYQMIEDYMSLLRSARDGALGEGSPLPERLGAAMEHILRYQRSYVENRNGRYL